MIITQQTFGMPDAKGISVKVVKDERSGRYTATITIELMNSAAQMVSVAGDNLEALIPTIDLCPICNIELHEKDLVAYGNNLPMANPNVDDYENLPF
jgi:uncharacterized protein with PIN domain